MFNRVGVYIGRFQPLHKGHCSAISQIIYKFDKTVILVGSAHSSRSPKNPFNAQQRMELIRAYLKAEHPDKVKDVYIAQLKDFANDYEWENEVQRIVKSQTSEKDLISLCGYQKDISTYYLAKFPQWEFFPLFMDYPVNATDVRRILFENSGDPFLLIHPSCVELIKKFSQDEKFDDLRKEYKFIQAFKDEYADLKYPPVFATVDAAILDSKDKVLMIRRKDYPGKKYLALPGGFVKDREYLIEALNRIVLQKTDIDIAGLKPYASKVFDNPDRSLRGRTITHVYLYKLPSVGESKGKATWLNTNQLFLYEEEIFEDHKMIIESFL